VRVKHIRNELVHAQYKLLTPACFTSPLEIRQLQQKLDDLQTGLERINFNISQELLEVETESVVFNSPKYSIGRCVFGLTENSVHKIVLPPGAWLSKLAMKIISEERYEREVQPALADWHMEYFEALDQGRGRVRMASIRIRNSWAFFKATGWLFGLIAQVMRTGM